MADDILTDQDAGALLAQVRAHPPLLTSAQVDAMHDVMDEGASMMGYEKPFAVG